MRLGEINTRISAATAHISVLKGDHKKYQRERQAWDEINEMEPYIEETWAGIEIQERLAETVRELRKLSLKRELVTIADLKATISERQASRRAAEQILNNPQGKSREQRMQATGEHARSGPDIERLEKEVVQAWQDFKQLRAYWRGSLPAVQALEHSARQGIWKSIDELKKWYRLGETGPPSGVRPWS